MRPLVIYFTRTNNTTPVAQAVAAQLDADLIRVDEISEAELQRQMQGRPLIALGTGVYNSRPAKQILRLIAKVPKGAKLFFFFTSGLTAPFLLEWYQRPIRKLARKHGVDLAGIWRCPGHDKHPAFKWANLHVDRPSRQDLDEVKAAVAVLKR